MEVLEEELAGSGGDIRLFVLNVGVILDPNARIIPLRPQHSNFAAPGIPPHFTDRRVDIRNEEPNQLLQHVR